MALTFCRLFFQSGKVVPIDRGGGLEQPSLAVMAKQLGLHGDWLHVFPEGRITYDGKLADFRWGVGRMICDVMKNGDGRCESLAPLED
jgi:monolysocardiolipin acyltransferase